MLFVGIFGALFLFSSTGSASKCESPGVWTWICKDEVCVKVEAKGSPVIEVNTCKLTCGKYSSLLPKPSGSVQIGKATVPFLPSKMQLSSVTCGSGDCPVKVKWLVENAFNRFQNTLTNAYLAISKKKKRRTSFFCVKEANQRTVEVSIDLGTTHSKLTLGTDESSSLSISTDESIVSVQIQANTFFGARHAMETVSQLTMFDEAHNSLQIVFSVSITDDKPAYPYRGIMLDTSRNFFSTESIMRLITAMSYNKMNTLHWHITDTHSFPIEIPSVPELHKYGAYTPERIYAHEDVKKIVNHGLIHGVRILPEFDQPAHCGEGWQWGPSKGLGNLAVCIKKEPWQKYCVEPPCGQLNPTNMKIYDVLGKIYKTYFDLFSPDIYHAGGDEININCWNTTDEITTWMQKNLGGVTEKHYLELWGGFLKKSSKKIIEANGNKELPLILWTSKMTAPKYLNKYLDPKKHIVQIWTSTQDKQIPNLALNGFKTIFSTYNTLYLDCGYGNWLVEGNNWCSPYKDWKSLYQNDPVKILKHHNVTVTDTIRKNILGQEAAMWSEQVDEHSSEGKIWPRVSALAERLWSNPSHGWQPAVNRMVTHRERMTERGIQADALQPLWCQQNSGFCYYDPAINKGEHFMI